MTAHDLSPEAELGDDGDGGSNITYADGHVEHHALDEMQARDFGLKDGVNGRASDDHEIADNLDYRR